MGADSADSGHSGDDGNSTLSEVIAENSFNYDGNDGDREDEEVVAVHEEVVAVYAADENADENVVAVATVCHRPQSLPIRRRRGRGAAYCTFARICCTWGRSV